MEITINAILAELHFMYVTSGIVMPIFIALGLIGNCLILIVLCGKLMRSSPACLLQALAIHDILNMLYAAYADVYPAVNAYKKANIFVKSLPKVKRDELNILSFEKIFYTVSYRVLQLAIENSNYSLFDQINEPKYKTETVGVSMTTSKTVISTSQKYLNSFTDKDRKEFIIGATERFIGYNIIYSGLLFALCLTSERCIAVVFPMKVGNCLTIGRTRLLILLSILVCLIVHSPQLIKEIVSVYKNPEDLLNEEKGLILSFRSAYERFYVISSLIICLAMLTLNFVLLCKIRTYRKSMKMSKHTKRIERNELNVSLLIVVLIFFQLPHYVFVIIISFISKEIYFEDFTTITRTTVIIRLLYILQASLNFVIYCLFAKRFREVIRSNYSRLFQKLISKTGTDKPEGNLQKNMTTFAHFMNMKSDLKNKQSSSV